MLLFHILFNRNLPEILLNGARSLEVLYNILTEAKMSFEMSVLTEFKPKHYFHAVILMSREAGKKNLNVNRGAGNNTLTGMEFQIAQKAWNMLKKSCSLRPLWVVKKTLHVLQPC